MLNALWIFHSSPGSSHMSRPQSTGSDRAGGRDGFVLFPRGFLGLPFVGSTAGLGLPGGAGG